MIEKLELSTPADLTLASYVAALMQLHRSPNYSPSLRSLCHLGNHTLGVHVADVPIASKTLTLMYGQRFDSYCLIKVLEDSEPAGWVLIYEPLYGSAKAIYSTDGEVS